MGQKTIKKGSRNGCNRYLCKDCSNRFSINHRRFEKPLWIPHIDGISFRKLGDENNLVASQVYKRVFEEIKLLPSNLEITKTLCEYKSGILIIDGKYIKIRGFKKKIPFIYVIDYETHDILFSLVSQAENKIAFLKIFKTLKELNYPLQVVVADDRTSLPLALKEVFHDIPVQLCLNHYLENIRQLLHVRTDTTHQHFFNTLKKYIFYEYCDNNKLNETLIYIFNKFCINFSIRKKVIMEISRRRKLLFVYKNINNCPNNTNLIELFNSHFNARLKSLKGFKIMEHAKLWLNAIVLRRRTQPFTDCSPKFKHLNGKTSLEMSIKKQAP